MRWQQGQHGKYSKLKLVSFGNFEICLMRIPLHGFIQWHYDSCVSLKRKYKLSLFLKKALEGGQLRSKVLWLDGERNGAQFLTMRHKRRLVLMRPDRTEHSVSEVTKGSALILAIWWTW